MKKRAGVLAAVCLASLMMLQGCGSDEDMDLEDTSESLAEETADAEDETEETEAEATEEADAEAKAEDQSEAGNDLADTESLSTEAPNYDDMYPLSLVMATEKYSELADDGTLVVNGYRQIVRLEPKAQNTISHDASDNQALSDAVDSLMEELKTSYEADLKDTVDSYVEDGEGYDDETLPFNSDISISVPRADSSVMSIAVMGTSYSGGAHGNAGVTTYNYDSITGRQLSLDDVITDKSDLAERIKDGISSDVMLQVDDSYFDQAVEDGSLSFILDNAGITFYFSPYEIASYADGIVTSTIPYFGNEDIFNPAYSMSLMSYTVQIQSGFPYVDYAADASVPGRLTAYFTDGQYNDGTAQLTVATDAGSDTQDAAGAYSASFIYAETIDYGVIVYADVKYDDDGEKIYVWKLESSASADDGQASVKFVGTCDLGQAVYPEMFDDETTVSYFQMMTCDEEMCLSDGRETGIYYVGTDYMPVKAE